MNNEKDVISYAEQRKQSPVWSGVLNYFPDAIRGVAHASFIGNEQHNPNTPLHWDRSKSGDELDALSRHLIEAGTVDDDGVLHSTKVAWRALANLQKELERAGEAPLSEHNEAKPKGTLWHEEICCSKEIAEIPYQCTPDDAINYVYSLTKDMKGL